LKNVEQVRRLLSNARISDERFTEELPTTPLHWIFADKSSSVTVEQSEQGLKIYENPYGVLSNSPDFASQIYNLERYLHIIEADRRIAELHSRGLDGFGIPGDFSSGSRFVRAVFAKSRTLPEQEKCAAISRFLHLFDSLSQPNGITRADDGKSVRTVYTSAIDTHSLEYCFTTYENRRVRCVKLDTPPAVGENLLRFPMHSGEDFLELN
jgi:choloylglycine hydrolase